MFHGLHLRHGQDHPDQHGGDPDEDDGVDPELRLRITRTATESLAESNREDDRRRAKKKEKERARRHTFRKTLFGSGAGGGRKRPGTAGTTSTSESGIGAPTEDGMVPLGEVGETTDDERDRPPSEGRLGGAEGGKVKGKKGQAVKKRRNVYVNIPLPMHELNSRGEPASVYNRNKVRTSKYTIWSFLPKNLMEQFRRVANIYFLILVILQVFPIFGAAAPQIAMLPLLAILTITAVKDGIEDWRRNTLDNQVNNSAVTRLGDWKNVNIRIGGGNWFTRLFTKEDGTKVSRGVKKLRERERQEGKGPDGSFAGLYSTGGLASSTTADFSKFRRSESSVEVGQTLRYDQAAGNSSAAITPMDEVEEVVFKNSVDSAGASGRGGSQQRPHPVGRTRSQTVTSHATSSVRTRASGGTAGVIDYDAPPSSHTAKWERTLWKKLEVGDIVLLRENDQVPADVVLLSSSDPDGMCFVETKNLDGETNLKPRKSLKATMGLYGEEDIEHSRFYIDSEPPHANLYSYNAVMRYSIREEQIGREHPVEEGRQLRGRKELQEPITINEMLLRGCAVRNTAWVIGLVVFTGADTKIMLNQGETPSKRSKIEKETNFNVIVNFVILVTLCLVCALADGFYLSSSDTSGDLYELGTTVGGQPILDGLVTFGSCLILFQNIVPISLVITVELVKTIQAFFIYQDLDMYYEPLDHPCVPKTWNISDDLGQIEYIFSDKTGTLTQNVMEFKKCSVNGVPYGEGITEAMIGAAKREGRDMSAFDPVHNAEQMKVSKASMVHKMTRLFKNRYLQEDKLTLIAPKLIEDLEQLRSPQRQNIIEFFRALAICQSVLSDTPDRANPFHVEYKAESPDEAALVAAARDVGFVFVGKTNSEVELEVMGQTERYQPLRVCEFNSSRKRMSVVVRAPDGRIILYCKGADSVVYQRLRADHDPQLKESTNKDLESFANAGLRTLCIAYKYLSDEEFAGWAATYDAALSAIQDREEEVEKAADVIERDLIILGATALEDKLQDGVPDAIEQLHRAGLKLWILTGDKLQTAIEIGYSCNLLSSDMEIMIISADTFSGARAQIESGLDKISARRHSYGKDEKISAAFGGFAVVIDGDTLRFALDVTLKVLFLELTTQCETVVCCRVSPSQKAQTVRLVKEGRNAMTLAIGDGANDVAMIQEAHIGVGIAGLEGAQASMSADYAVGQFRYLTKLLLVHGRWCYVRVADMHSNFFYKNIVWTFAMFWYQIFCSYQAVYLFDYTFVLLFNLVCTSLPVANLGIFDRDVDARSSLMFPQLYKRGIKGLDYTRTIFFAYMLDGLYQSVVVFWVPLFIYWDRSTSNSSGHDDGLAEFGTTVAIGVVIVVNLFVGVNTRLWTWITSVVISISCISLFIWIAIYSFFPTFNFRGVFVNLVTSPDFYASFCCVTVLCLLPRFLYKYVQAVYFPLDTDIVRERFVSGFLARDMRDEEAVLDREQSALHSPPVLSRSSTHQSVDGGTRRSGRSGSIRSVIGGGSGSGLREGKRTSVYQHPEGHEMTSMSAIPIIAKEEVEDAEPRYLHEDDGQYEMVTGTTSSLPSPHSGSGGPSPTSYEMERPPTGAAFYSQEWAEQRTDEDEDFSREDEGGSTVVGHTEMMREDSGGWEQVGTGHAL